MNIHEHQAKQLLKKYGAVVPEGIFALNVEDLLEKAKSLKTDKYVLKAQIHAGGRGKAGGVKILNTLEELELAAKEMLGKTLITHQTGPEGRKVKRLYVEESSNIEKEFYLSCLVDRASSKIAFISSDQGGMDIEEVASNNPEKIITTKGTFIFISLAASTTPCARTSHLMIPPKILIKIPLTFLSERISLSAAETFSFDAPPPTSKKLAGSLPYNFIMSIVAIANPAPFTIQPMLPSNLI